MPTFADLGLEIPLFRCDVEEAVEYRGECACHLCGSEEVHCFELEPISQFAATCPECDVTKVVLAFDKGEWRCPQCDGPTPPKDFLPATSRTNSLARVFSCFACLQQQRASLYKTTSLGSLDLEGVRRKATELSLYNDEDLDAVRAETSYPLTFEASGDEQVGRVELPDAVIQQLAVTPNYRALQGAVWLFCCDQPMPYLGPWTREQFEAQAPGGGFDLFRNSIQKPWIGTFDSEPERKDITEDLWHARWADTRGYYVFRCDVCAQFKTHWDYD